MKRLPFILVLIAMSVGAFAVGRATSTAPPPSEEMDVTTKTTAAPTSTPSAEVAPRRHRSILRFFATADEQALPEQGILGGTMVAGTIAFPKDFVRESGETFYVVGSDGHLLETWTYEMKSAGGWKHVDTQDGYAPVDFQDHLHDYDVYLWRPAFYIPAENSF